MLRMNYSVRKAERAEEERGREDWGSLSWLASGEVGGTCGLTVGKVVIHPGKSNPRHSHPSCEEVLHLLSGRLRHSVGSEEVVLEAGDTLLVEAETPHHAVNIGETDAVMIVAYNAAERDFEPE